MGSDLDTTLCTFSTVNYPHLGYIYLSLMQILVIYEAMIPQSGSSVVQVLAVTVDIGVVTYKAMTPQCLRSVVQVPLVRVDIGVVTYEAMTP